MHFSSFPYAILVLLPLSSMFSSSFWRPSSTTTTTISIIFFSSLPDINNISSFYSLLDRHHHQHRSSSSCCCCCCPCVAVVMLSLLLSSPPLAASISTIWSSSGHQEQQLNFIFIVQALRLSPPRLCCSLWLWISLLLHWRFSTVPGELRRVSGSRSVRLSHFLQLILVDVGIGFIYCWFCVRLIS